MEFSKYNEKQINSRYEEAKEIYSTLGVDVDEAVKLLNNTQISMHCWQGDDVGGFEVSKSGLSGGIMTTGNYPGKANTPEELRQDADKAMSLLPGKQRFNLHACYLETNGKFVERDMIAPEHFANWVDWAKNKNISLDFNPTFFGHPKSEDGFTLSSANEDIRKYWIEHAKRCREISVNFAKEFNDNVIVNYWIPDGAKDFPADRWSPRERLTQSYNEIFKDKIDIRVKEAMESKVFGIGSEEYVVGSAEYYLSYALTNNKLLCMDMGHYHPTETIHDKLSAVLGFMPEVLLHVSRPIRWDSDHVVVLNDDLMSLCREIVRGNALNRIYLATDFFDASINRIGAWVTGIRSLQKALLFALLDPTVLLKKFENNNQGAERLAMMEECKTLPYADVWNYICLKADVPVGPNWIKEMQQYEKTVLVNRNK